MQKFVSTLVACSIVTLSFAQTTTLFNDVVSNLWNDAGNWSNGIPTSTMTASIAANTQVIIPNGYIAEALDVTGAQDFILRPNSVLNVHGEWYNNSGDTLTNNGTIVFHATTSQLNINGGEIINNDSIAFINPNAAMCIRLNEGTFTNKGSIYMNSPEIGIEIPALTFITPRIFDNRPLGKIYIQSPSLYGIWLKGNMQNKGLIEITNVFRHHPNVPCVGFLLETGSLTNTGSITIIGSTDAGIINDGAVFTNDTTGTVSLNGYGTTALQNDFIIYNHGSIDIACSNPNATIGIHNSGGSFYNKATGQININGENRLDKGIEVNLTFTNDSLGTINIENAAVNGVEVDGSFFHNNGNLTISDMPDLYDYAILVKGSSFFNQNRNATFTNCDGGVSVNTNGHYNNNGTTSMYNMGRIGSFVTGYLVNNGTIQMEVNDGPPTPFGLTFGGGIGTNNGAIVLDSVQQGIEVRTTTFTNNGTIQIKRFGTGLIQFPFNNFPEPKFVNNQKMIFQDQYDELGHAIYLASLVPEVYTLVNNANDSILMNGVHNGIFVTAGGVDNYGTILGNDITEAMIRMYFNQSNAKDFLNRPTGVVFGQNTHQVIYFEGSGSATSHIPFINQGTFAFKNITDKPVASFNSVSPFINTGRVSGEGTLDMSIVSAIPKADAGYNDGGILQLQNFSQHEIKRLAIDFYGNNGVGNNTGHDGLVTDDNLILTNDTLEVRLQNGFVPEPLTPYNIILTSGSQVIDTFKVKILPTLPSDQQWQVIYESNKVSLQVLPKSKIWTGISSTNWSDASNWDDNMIPDLNSYVVIPSGTPKFPIFTNNATLEVNQVTVPMSSRCKSLTIQPGGQVIFNNSKLKNAGTINVNGTLTFNRVTPLYMGPFISNTAGGSIIIGSTGSVISD